MLNASLKSTETREELSTTCNPKVMSKCLPAPDATYLHHCLKNEKHMRSANPQRLQLQNM